MLHFKAVREAWESERQLVLEGKGTRDWTPEQQQHIIDKGKAYDNNGRAFDGHHMKSVEAYPQYQGDSGNIQFLSRREHQDAHGGSFLNPTNGCFDPRTHSTKDFGINIYESCEVIILSNPVIYQNINEYGKENSPESKLEIKVQKIGAKVKNVVERVVDFGVRHPSLVKIVKWTGIVAASAVSGKAVYNSEKSKRDRDNLPSSASGEHYDFSTDQSESSESSIERDYPDKRYSPRKHNVSGYDRQQNGKPVHVKSYPRGENKNK